MNKPFHSVLTFTVVALALTVGVQWSWNPSALLFGASVLEFRHALALLFLTATLQWPRTPTCRHWRRARDDE
jgi:hypothetical protein